MPAAGGEQLGLALGPYNDRPLFSKHFLEDILPETPEYTALDLEGVPERLVELWRYEREGLLRANEAQTEERFIKPVLGALGFEWTVHVGVPFRDGRRQPDYALRRRREPRRRRRR